MLNYEYKSLNYESFNIMTQLSTYSVFFAISHYSNHTNVDMITIYMYVQFVIYIFVHDEDDVNKLKMYDCFSDRLFVWLYIRISLCIYNHVSMFLYCQCISQLNILGIILLV